MYDPKTGHGTTTWSKPHLPKRATNTKDSSPTLKTKSSAQVVTELRNAPEPPRILLNKYAGTHCSKCQQPVAYHTRIYWYPTDHRIEHLNCNDVPRSHKPVFVPNVAYRQHTLKEQSQTMLHTSQTQMMKRFEKKSHAA